MTIQIDINVGRDADSSSVSFEGDQIDLISNEDRSAFGLSETKLLDGIKIIRGKRPGKAFMRDHPLFEKYDWQQTQRVLAVRSAKVLSLDIKPVALVSNSYENMRGKSPTTHTATLTYAAALSKASTWSSGTKISVGHKINYKIGVPSNEIGGETSYGLEASFGVGGTVTRTSTITAANAVNFVIEPGNSATAMLSASQGTLRIQVEYDAYLTGQVYYDYETPFEGHHHYASPISYLMEDMGIENNQTVTQTLEIGFYSNAKVIVRDDETATDIQEGPAKITLDE